MKSGDFKLVNPYLQQVEIKFDNCRKKLRKVYIHPKVNSNGGGG
ncbi:MAG: hypothetical protein QXE86_05490 [Archaeoglobaceae archaeon]